MQRECSTLAHRRNQRRRRADRARRACSERIQERVELRFFHAPAQHRQKPESVGLDIRHGNAPAKTIRIGRNQRSDLGRRTCGRRPIAGEREQRFAGGGNGEVSIGRLRG